ncbi:MAG: CvpA family protein [Balneolaceae bacterium]
MSLFDLAILLILVFFSFQGFRNGLVKEILTLAGLVVALFVALLYMDLMGGWISGVVDLSEEGASVLAATLLFTAVFLIALITAHLIRKFLEVIHLNLLNRLLGLVFGGVKSALAVSLVLILLAGWNIPGEDVRQGSLIYSYILNLGPILFDQLETLLPENSPELWSHLLKPFLRIV